MEIRAQRGRNFDEGFDLKREMCDHAKNMSGYRLFLATDFSAASLAICKDLLPDLVIGIHVNMRARS